MLRAKVGAEDIDRVGGKSKRNSKSKPKNASKSISLHGSVRVSKNANVIRRPGRRVSGVFSLSAIFLFQIPISNHLTSFDFVLYF